MNQVLFAITCVLFLGLGACNSGTKSSADATVSAPVKDAFGTMPKTGANYGDGVAKSAKPMDYTALIKTVETKGTTSAVIEGTVVEVCQKKGCWMTLEPKGGPSNVSVRFKDYGFFMPKTLSGSQVIVQGTATEKEISVEDLRHYAEDAGKSAEEIAAITKPEKGIELMATGVRVL